MRIDINYRLIAKYIQRGGGYVDNTDINRVYIPNPKYIPLGVYANKKYNKNDTIRVMHGTIHLKSIPGGIKIGDQMYIMDDYGKYIGSSDTPNAIIKQNKIVALKDINSQDEITLSDKEL